MKTSEIGKPAYTSVNDRQPSSRGCCPPFRNLFGGGQELATTSSSDSVNSGQHDDGLSTRLLSGDNTHDIEPSILFRSDNSRSSRCCSLGTINREKVSEGIKEMVMVISASLTSIAYGLFSLLLIYNAVPGDLVTKLVVAALVGVAAFLGKYMLVEFFLKGSVIQLSKLRPSDFIPSSRANVGNLINVLLTVVISGFWAWISKSSMEMTAGLAESYNSPAGDDIRDLLNDKGVLVTTVLASFLANCMSFFLVFATIYAKANGLLKESSKSLAEQKNVLVNQAKLASKLNNLTNSFNQLASSLRDNPSPNIEVIKSKYQELIGLLQNLDCGLSSSAASSSSDPATTVEQQKKHLDAIVQRLNTALNSEDEQQKLVKKLISNSSGNTNVSLWKDIVLRRFFGMIFLPALSTYGVSNIFELSQKMVSELCSSLELEEPDGLGVVIAINNMLATFYMMCIVGDGFPNMISGLANPEIKRTSPEVLGRKQQIGVAVKATFISGVGMTPGMFQAVFFAMQAWYMAFFSGFSSVYLELLAVVMVLREGSQKDAQKTIAKQLANTVLKETPTTQNQNASAPDSGKIAKDVLDANVKHFNALLNLVTALVALDASILAGENVATGTGVVVADQNVA